MPNGTVTIPIDDYLRMLNAEKQLKKLLDAENENLRMKEIESFIGQFEFKQSLRADQNEKELNHVKTSKR